VLLPALLPIVLLGVLAACDGHAPRGHPVDRPPPTVSAVAGASAAGASVASAADGEWPMPARDYASTRYSPLTEITVANAPRLRAVWSFSTGVLRGHEGQPLVVGTTMYVTTPFPNITYAFDLTREGFPLKWKYRPAVNEAAVGIACCDAVNRGPTYADGRLYVNLLDAYTVALDAATGRELWRTKIGEINKGETATMAPFVVKGKVLVGVSGGEFGVRGRLDALDVATGKLVWRAYSAGSDKDVLIDQATFKPFYAKDRGVDLGLKSWPAGGWTIGGGAAWAWISYDPALDLVYYGTGNPAPYNPLQRPGDNKWTTSLLARDPDDGTLRWAYQQTPHDNWDYDGNNENILADLPVNGTTRKLLVHFDRNGFAYTMDRATGEVLVAEPFVPVNWATGVDLRTGAPRINPEKTTAAGKVTKDICPSLEGGKDQQPGAFSPRTKLFYTPTNNMCMDWAAREVSYIAGTPYIGASSPYHAGPGGYRGEFLAWDAVRGRKVWGIKELFPVWGGALVTAGDVVFYGTLDGWFKAVDARQGRVLWKFKVGSGVVGNPIAFRGPDGRQYVAVYSGIGGDLGALIAGDVRSDAPYDTRGVAEPLTDLAMHTSWGGMVWIFGL
jgi:PQQ-dependent dehydrogenase (methanol/ethanol family)